LMRPQPTGCCRLAAGSGKAGAVLPTSGCREFLAQPAACGQISKLHRYQAMPSHHAAKP
jgi:hypothetical protein